MSNPNRLRYRGDAIDRSHDPKPAPFEKVSVRCEYVSLEPLPADVFERGRELVVGLGRALAQAHPPGSFRMYESGSVHEMSTFDWPDEEYRILSDAREKE